jgi:hypothetical protein
MIPTHSFRMDHSSQGVLTPNLFDRLKPSLSHHFVFGPLLARGLAGFSRRAALLLRGDWTTTGGPRFSQTGSDLSLPPTVGSSIPQAHRHLEPRPCIPPPPFPVEVIPRPAGPTRSRTGTTRPDSCRYTGSRRRRTLTWLPWASP